MHVHTYNTHIRSKAVLILLFYVLLTSVEPPVKQPIMTGAHSIFALINFLMNNDGHLIPLTVIAGNMAVFKFGSSAPTQP